MAHPLKTYRAQHDLSLQNFADLLGVQGTTISKIETGRQPASAKMAIEIERVTGGVVPRHILRPDFWDAPEQAAERPRGNRR